MNKEELLRTWRQAYLVKYDEGYLDPYLKELISWSQEEALQKVLRWLEEEDIISRRLVEDLAEARGTSPSPENIFEKD